VAEDEVPTTIAEAMAATAYALELPVEDVTGYVIVGILVDGSYRLTSNATSLEQAAGTLADVAAQTMYSIAAQQMVPAPV
jgi:hypothetical protein